MTDGNAKLTRRKTHPQSTEMKRRAPAIRDLFNKELGAVHDMFHSHSLSDRHPVMDKPLPYWASGLLYNHVFTDNMKQHYNFQFLANIDLTRPESSGFERLKNAIEDAKQSGRRLIIRADISGLSGAVDHAVVMMYEPGKNRLIYQDPEGHDMRPSTRDFFAREFESLNIHNLKLKQQHDMASCAYISFFNAACLALEEPLVEDIDIARLRGNIHSVLEEKSRIEAQSMPEGTRTEFIKGRTTRSPKGRKTISQDEHRTIPSGADFLTTRQAELWQVEP